MMIKKLLTFFLVGIWFFAFASANVDLEHTEYLYFYGQGCPHCIKVEQYFEKSKIDKKISISAHEIWQDPAGRELFRSTLEKIDYPMEQTAIPFLVISASGTQAEVLLGDQPIISYFKGIEAQLKGETAVPMSFSGAQEQKLEGSFLAVMLPAAVADSINPCAFAVMLLLLGTILSKSKNKKKTFFAGLLFCLAIFICYYLMGVGILRVLATASNLFILKWVVGILGLLVGLANIKDYFRYGKGFVMEVPLARRPKMMKLIQSVVSPWWAFLVGILVSLFLLPCSSGPYFTILGYLGSENQTLNLWGHVYLGLYNFIFVLPMLLITVLVSFGFASVEHLAKLKNKNTKLIHLIVGLLMLGLGIYVIGSLYWRG